VVVTSVLTRPIHLPLEEWIEKVEAANSSQDLADGFLRSAMGGAESRIRQARVIAREQGERETETRPPRPEKIEVRAPGEVELEMLDDSDFTLIDRYDPEEYREESYVTCQVLRWKTEFYAPGTARMPDEDYDEAHIWRVGQWRWVPDDEDFPE